MQNLNCENFMNEFLEFSYSSHRNHRPKKQNDSLTFQYQSKDSVDQWRHNRMYDTISPFLEATDSWLTVGDGTYGKDAQFLQNWVSHVTATDIDISQ